MCSLSTANFWFSVLNSCVVNVFPRGVIPKGPWVWKSQQKATTVRARKLDQANWKHSKVQTQTDTLAYAEQHACKHSLLFYFSYQAWLLVLHLGSASLKERGQVCSLCQTPEHQEHRDRQRVWKAKTFMVTDPQTGSEVIAKSNEAPQWWVESLLRQMLSLMVIINNGSN